MLAYIQNIPEGYSKGMYQNKKYGISKSVFNEGSSLKIYAKELGGTNFISLNYYQTKLQDLLKPCEMPEKKVIHFLKNVTFKSTE